MESVSGRFFFFTAHIRWQHTRFVSWPMVSRPAVHRCSKPTRPDKARKVGYKARAKQPTNGWGVWGGGFRVGFDSNSKDVLVLKLTCFFFWEDDVVDVMAIMGPAEKDDEDCLNINEPQWTSEATLLERDYIMIRLWDGIWRRNSDVFDFHPYLGKWFNDYVNIYIHVYIYIYIHIHTKKCCFSNGLKAPTCESWGQAGLLHLPCACEARRS